MKYRQFENFELSNNIPTNGLVAWMETSQYNAETNNYIAVSSWTPASVAPPANLFSTKNADKNTQPFVRTNVLNGNAVLQFNPRNSLSMENNITNGVYTMIFVSRQLKMTNQTFINDDKESYFYSNGKKERLSTFRETFFPPDSNDVWDIVVIRGDGTRRFLRNLGTDLAVNSSGNSASLQGNLNLNSPNAANNSDAQIAEFILYNNFVSNSDVMNIETYLATKYGLLDFLDPTNSKSMMRPTPVRPGADPRANPNLPTSSLMMWFDASSLTAQSTLSTWANKAKPFNDSVWTYTKTANDAEIIKNGLNDLPVVKISPNNVFQLNNYNKESLSVFKDYTISFLSRQTGGANNAPFSTRGTLSGRSVVYGYQSGNKQVIEANGLLSLDIGNPLGTIVRSDTNWDWFVITYNHRSLYSLYRNGSLIYKNVPSPNNAVIPFDGLDINNGNPKSDLEIAEILIWNKCLNDSEIVGLDSYFINKWDVGVFLQNKNDVRYVNALIKKREKDFEKATKLAEELKLQQEKDRNAFLKLQQEEALIAKQIADKNKKLQDEAALNIAIAQEKALSFQNNYNLLQQQSAKQLQDKAIEASIIQEQLQKNLKFQKDQEAALKNMLSNANAESTEIAAAAKKYAAEQKKLLEETNVIWTAKLNSANQDLINKTNLFNLNLQNVKAEGDATLTSKLQSAKLNYELALQNLEALNATTVKNVRSEEAAILKSAISKAQSEYNTAVQKFNQQKIAMQESSDQLLSSTLDGANKNFNLRLSNLNDANNIKYTSLQESELKIQKLLNEQITNLQNRYNFDINKIITDANKKYNQLEASDLIKIDNLQKQYLTAINSLTTARSEIQSETSLYRNAHSRAQSESDLYNKTKIQLLKAQSDYNAALDALNIAKSQTQSESGFYNNTRAQLVKAQEEYNAALVSLRSATAQAQSQSSLYNNTKLQLDKVQSEYKDLSTKNAELLNSINTSVKPLIASQISTVDNYKNLYNQTIEQNKKLQDLIKQENDEFNKYKANTPTVSPNSVNYNDLKTIKTYLSAKTSKKKSLFKKLTPGQKTLLDKLTKDKIKVVASTKKAAKKAATKIAKAAPAVAPQVASANSITPTIGKSGSILSQIANNSV